MCKKIILLKIFVIDIVINKLLVLLIKCFDSISVIFGQKYVFEICVKYLKVQSFGFYFSKIEFYFLGIVFRQLNILYSFYGDFRVQLVLKIIVKGEERNFFDNM